MIRAALLALLVATSALSQSIDYSMRIDMNDAYYAGAHATYTFVVMADRNDDQPFIARVAVPPELEYLSCSHSATYDPAARVITWSDRLNYAYTTVLSCPCTFRMSPALTPQSSFELAASVESKWPDPNTANNIAIVKGYVVPAADLVLTATPQPVRYVSGDLATYLLTVTNSGPNDAADVSLVDAFSEFLDFVSFTQLSGPVATIDPVAFGSSSTCYQPRCGSYVEAHIPALPSGSSATFKLTAKTKTSVESAYIVNHASVRTPSFDPQLRNNDADSYTAMGPDADLTIDSTTTSEADGIRIPIAISVSSSGPSAVTNVVVDQQLKSSDDRYDFVRNVKYVSATASQGSCEQPRIIALAGSPEPPAYWGVTCNVGALAPGQHATVTVVVERSAKAGPFDATAAVSPAENDPLQSNNSSTLHIKPPGPRRRSVR